MNVRMEGKVASPGVEDADEPDLCTQMSLVPGELFQGCCTAVIEQAEEKAPVGKKETVELLRDGEDGMKVWCINDISLPGINPFVNTTISHCHQPQLCRRLRWSLSLVCSSQTIAMMFRCFGGGPSFLGICVPCCLQI